MTLVERLRAAGCVFAEEEAAILLSATDDPAELEAMVRRRVEGTPLEYVVGWAEFAGRRILVDEGVFVPRPRSEALVDEAVARGGKQVLDLCCGTGAIGLVVAERLDARLHASDVDPRAVANARRNGVNAYEGDLYDALPPLTADLIVLVAPYVPTDEMRLLPREARLFEPATALDGGLDGLELVRRVVSGARSWLAEGGWLLTEVSEAQAAVVVAAMEDAGFAASIAGDGIVVAGQYR